MVTTTGYQAIRLPEILDSIGHGAPLLKLSCSCRLSLSRSAPLTFAIRMTSISSDAPSPSHLSCRLT